MAVATDFTSEVPFGGRLYINGKAEAGAAEIPLINPATEEAVCRVGAASIEQIQQAIGAARNAFDNGEWPRLSKRERTAVLVRMLDYFGNNAERIRRLIVTETGCPSNGPIMGAQWDLPLANTREILDYYLTLPEFEQNPVPVLQRISASGAFVESLKRYVPVGVVSAITAYNFPFFLNVWKVIPALMTGNTVVLRPSPLTPLTALTFAEAAEAAGLPAGVLNVIIDGGHEGGMLMTTDPRVDMVTFTGSTHVGELVAAQAAKGIKRVQLELGGKSAQIYLPDRLDAASGAALSVCLSHSGQGCVLGTRVFVPNEAKAAVLEQMAASVANLKLGDPFDPATQMGPVVSAAQRERCERYVAAAVAAGGRVVTGGKRPAHLDRGFFFEPTVLDLPDNRNPAAQDEIFGPVVGVIGYDSIDHAVNMANDTIFGLSGYVFGRDLRQAIAVAQRLRTGTVNVNSGGMSGYASSGGFGASGIGRERGLEGIRVYEHVQVMNISN